ncbi:MAG: DUF86 domain-containing protein [Bacteroidales bacterium]|nr:DUF86 domain-containing protein [Bacteroidales bacterium]
MFEKELAIIELLLESVEKIENYTKDFNNSVEFEKDTKSFDACLMNFIAIGESVGKLSEEFKENNNNINWRKIYAFRNVLAHDYFGILPAEVWEIIRKFLPKLKIDLIKISTNKNP